MTPPRKEIEDLKAAVDLVALFQAFGMEIRKQGRGVKALCPFHDEKTPSLSIDPKKGLYKCFGCGKAGDSLTFLQEHAKLSFAEAVAELRRHAGTQSAQADPVPITKIEEEPFPYDLMERVAEIWHQAFCDSPEALEYLENRGIHDRGLLRELRVGYCNGEKLLAITNAEERRLLQSVGVLNEGGKEFFSRCVVFALRDRHNRVTGFYGRSLSRDAKVPHRCCAGNRTGLFCVEAARGVSSVFLVEGVLDALALMQSGFSNTLALGGTQGLTPALVEHLRHENVKEIVLVMDGDQAGRQGAEQLSTRLTQDGFATRTIALPDGHDPLSCSDLATHLTPQPQLEKRKYQKLSASQGKLKVLVSLEQDGQKAEATVDLYSARSRKQAAIELARAGQECADIEAWFFTILNELEARKADRDEAKSLFGQVEVPPMTPQQRQEALDFLTQKSLVPAILAFVGHHSVRIWGGQVLPGRNDLLPDAPRGDGLLLTIVSAGSLPHAQGLPGA